MGKGNVTAMDGGGEYTFHIYCDKSWSRFRKNMFSQHQKLLLYYLENNLLSLNQYLRKEKQFDT